MSLPRYSKYKDSGVEWLGEVPGHWEVTTGRRIFSHEREAALPGDEQLSASQKYGVVPQNVLMELQDQKVVLALSGTEKFQHVQAGDFVISLRSFQGGIERSRHTGCVSPAYTVLRPRQSLDEGYWAFLLKSAGYVASLQSMTDGIRDGKAISYAQFGRVEVPVPSLPEQTAIAAFLDRETAKIDALVAEQERLIELLKEKRQAVISHAVSKGLNPKVPMKDSGVEWLGEIPAHWELRRLKHLSPRISGRLVYQPAQYFADDGVPFLMGNNVTERGLSWDDVKLIPDEVNKSFAQHALRAGDVVTVRVGAPGVTCVVPKEADGLNCGSLMIIRRADSFDSDWLAAVMNCPVIRTQIDRVQYGAAQEQINISDAVNFRIPTPPLPEQREVAAFARQEAARFDGLAAEAQRAIDLLQERRTALISAAVTGQIDVRKASGKAA